MPSGSKLAVRPEATEAEPPASDAAGVEKSSSAVLMLPATCHHAKPWRQQVEHWNEVRGDQRAVNMAINNCCPWSTKADLADHHPLHAWQGAVVPALDTSTQGTWTARQHQAIRKHSNVS